MSRMSCRLLFLFLFPSGMLCGAGETNTGSSVKIDIPFQKFVLENGLTLIVHQDRKAPIIGVNVWYHVGSKNEKLGRTGFAHLFEHLMFNGSENLPGEFFEPLEEVGATGMNGTTNVDRTNYFETVPTNALDLALWMESDRMGHLLGAITQEKLDEQRGVVQNEKRQGENQPYGKTRSLLTENTYPAGHPYSWSTIGSMEDLNAATVDDVKDWFRTYYGAANAVLVVAGDVEPDQVKQRVEHYFGDIPSGPPVSKHDVWIAKRRGTHRGQMQDRVPQARIYKVWNIPEWGSRQGALLYIVARILSSGKTSRFYKRLVYEDQIATDAMAYTSLREIGGQFHIQSTVNPDKSIGEVEKVLDEELERFIEDGPTQDELDRVRTQYLVGLIRGLERVGGFGGKSDLLAQNQVYGGRPDYYKTTVGYIEEATPETVQQAARRWLSDGVYVLEVHPFPKYKVSESGADRSRLPDAGTPPTVQFPELQRSTLSNGLKVILAERHAIPVIDLNLLVKAGYAADPAAGPGTASMTASMMDEGTATRSALQISEQASNLGTRLTTRASLDDSSVSLSALRSTLDESLALFADVILNPSFPQAELDRLKQERLARIQREKVTPFQMALRVLPRLLYGDDHSYGSPLTGTGTVESTEAMSRDDLVKFHSTWYGPNNGTLVVVGDTTLEEISPKLEDLFKGWNPSQVAKESIHPVPHKAESLVYLMDRPGSAQTVILAGQVAPPTNNPEEVAIGTMNRILGGSFSSRLNMNLREDKHWSYGAGSVLIGARGQRPLIIYAPVQTDKTKESIIEVDKELRQYLVGNPATAEELDRAQKGQTLSLPGRWETASSVGSTIASIVRYGLSDDYYETFQQRVMDLSRETIHASARNVIHPDKLVWVIVGDLAKVEKGVRDLNLGVIRRLDGDGEVMD